MQSKANTINILHTLDKKYGHIDPFLHHQTPFQLLIAVILSAQTTDNLVNIVTPALFARYPDAPSLKKASQESVELLIKRVNYFRTKAKNIIKTAQIIDEEFSGIIPDSIPELTKLAGVGRKVANVIVAEIFNKPEGVVVDTHIKRVSYRIGWTKSQNPTIIERDLMKAWPQEYYVPVPKQLILIGRNYCHPRTPDCPNCPLNQWCEKNILQPIKKVATKKNIL